MQSATLCFLSFNLPCRLQLAGNLFHKIIQKQNEPGNETELDACNELFCKISLACQNESSLQAFVIPYDASRIKGCKYEPIREL